MGSLVSVEVVAQNIVVRFDVETSTRLWSVSSLGVSHDPLKSPCFDGDFVFDSPPLLRWDFLLVTIVEGSPFLV